MNKRFVLLTVLFAGCRDVSTAYEPPDAFADTPTGQLTFSLRNDHAPAWPNSADIIYETQSSPGFPNSNGLLLQVPRTAGSAQLIMPAVQQTGGKTPWLSGAAMTNDGASIAFFDLNVYNPSEHQIDRIACAGTSDTIGTGSFLTSAMLRVRARNSSAESDQARITITFPGSTYNSNSWPSGNIAYPFHRLFEVEGVPFYRASFSPDGKQLVFSDGLQLRLWIVGQTTTTIIPNSTNGILPSWSPDGSLIAFSKPADGSAQAVSCSAINNSVALPLSTFGRTIYHNVTRDQSTLYVVKPDGSGLRSLGLGDGPAWSGDSRSIVAHRSGSLVRVALDTGTATTLPNTANSFEPAISRDDRYLAFARRSLLSGTEKPNYDIWVTAF